MNKCWICFDDVFAPTNMCECESKYAYVHNECLEKWIVSSNNMNCKFCKTEYKLSIINRFYNYKSIFYKKCTLCYNIFHEFGEYCIDHRII